MKESEREVVQLFSRFHTFIDLRNMASFGADGKSFILDLILGAVEFVTGRDKDKFIENYSTFDSRIRQALELRAHGIYMRSPYEVDAVVHLGPRRLIFVASAGWFPGLLYASKRAYITELKQVDETLMSLARLGMSDGLVFPLGGGRYIIMLNPFNSVAIDLKLGFISPCSVVLPPHYDTWRLRRIRDLRILRRLFKALNRRDVFDIGQWAIGNPNVFTPLRFELPPQWQGVYNTV